jgi:hypothetical protein
MGCFCKRKKREGGREREMDRDDRKRWKSDLPYAAPWASPENPLSVLINENCAVKTALSVVMGTRGDMNIWNVRESAIEAYV